MGAFFAVLDRSQISVLRNVTFFINQIKLAGIELGLVIAFTLGKGVFATIKSRGIFAIY